MASLTCNSTISQANYFTDFIESFSTQSPLMERIYSASKILRNYMLAIPALILLAWGISSLIGRIQILTPGNGSSTERTHSTGLATFRPSSASFTTDSSSIDEPSSRLVRDVINRWGNSTTVSTVQSRRSQVISGISCSSESNALYIADPHGNIEQIIFPIIRNNLGNFTGEAIYFDVRTHQEVPRPSSPDSNIIELPELQLDPLYSGENIVILGDVIDHCSLEQSKLCFYFLTYLMKQQQSMQAENSNYHPLSSILANHELQVFYDNARWNLGGNITLKRQIFNSIKSLIREELMEVSHVEGGIIATHSCISITFIQGLMNELDHVSQDMEYTDDEKMALREALQYFIQYQDSQDSNISFNNSRHSVTMRIANTHRPIYNEHLQALSHHINRLARFYIERAQFPTRGTLNRSFARSTVLFSDSGEGRNELGHAHAITPFWARPNFAGRLRHPNHTVPARAVQSIYGHHKWVGHFGRADLFQMGNGEERRFQHIVCTDGGAYSQGACIIEQANGVFSRCILGNI